MSEMATVRAACRVLVALCVATAGLLLPAPAATGAEKCVGVVVDARLLGGGVRTGCAKGDPDSGLDALTAAGFRYAFAPRQPGLVCQVDGAPACDRTTTTTYWSYWYRAKGSDTWIYASEGAGSHDPEPGSTEAWVWQEGGRRQPPGVAQRTICPVAADTPRPEQTSSTGADQGATKATAAKTSAPKMSTPKASAAATSAAPRTTVTSAEPSATSARPVSDTATAPPTSRPVTTPIATPASASATDDDGGTPWLGVAAGVALVAALGGAALLRSRQGGP